MAAAAAHHLKLVVDPNSRRVLYAEASGEAIEFLHSLLVSPRVSLPFDAATGNACIGNVYDSVEKLDAFAAAANFACGPLSLCHQQQQQQEEEEEEEEERFFLCAGGDGDGGGGGYVANNGGARCPSCGGEMWVPVPRGCPGAGCSSDAASSGGAAAVAGRARAALTCMLLDDLTVTPSAGGYFRMASSYLMSCVAPGMLREKVVCLGFMEVMEILETSLQSSTVLTDVFLRKNKKVRRFGKSSQ